MRLGNLDGVRGTELETHLEEAVIDWRSRVEVLFLRTDLKLLRVGKNTLLGLRLVMLLHSHINFILLING